MKHSTEGTGPTSAPAAGTRTGRLRLLKLAFYVAIVAAFGWFVATIEWSDLEGVEWGVGWIIAASVVALAFRYLGVYVWKIVLTRLGASDLPRFRTLADVYARAWLARYIPGTIPWIAGKIYLAAEHGISRSKLAVSTLVEAAAQIVSVGAVSLTLLALDPRIGEISPALRWLVALGGVAGFVAMAPPVFNRLVAVAMRLVRRGEPTVIGWTTVRDSLALYGGGALVSGLGYVLLIEGIAPEISASDIPFVIGAFGFAGVVGMLTPFVPAGVGTRDLTQGALLLIVLPAPMVALIVIVSRVWSAAVDLLFWAVALLLERSGGKAR